MAKSKTPKPKAIPPVVNSAPVETPPPKHDRDAPFQGRMDYYESLIGNVATVRMQLFQELLDPRRDLNHECGFPRVLSCQDYQTLYDRNPFAQRFVEVMAKEAFQTPPKVWESDDEESNTPFENDIDGLSKKLRGKQSWFKDDKGTILHDVMMRAAILSGIGGYGVIFGGLNDGLDPMEPVAGVEEKYSMPATRNGDGGTPKDWVDPYKDHSNDHLRTITTNGGFDPRYSLERTTLDSVLTVNADGEVKPKKGKRQVTFLKVFPEYQAQVTRWETNRASPRFNMPVSYLITFNVYTSTTNYSAMPTQSVNVHWTRIVHVPGENRQSDDYVSQPLMQPVFNTLMNLDKLFGASGEGYWKTCFTGLSLSTHPELGGNVKVDRADLKDQLENYENSLTRVLYLMGMEATTIAPTVVDPTPFIERNVEALCIKRGIPKRIFMGSERGELSSTQDEGDWDDKVRTYQNGYLIPNVAVPLYDWLIAVGAVTEPEEYSVECEALDAQTAKEKADTGLVVTQALAAATTAGIFASGLMTEEDFLADIMMFDRTMVQQWIQNAQDQQQQQIDDHSDMIAQGEPHGLQPTPPAGYEPSPPPPPEMPPLDPIKLKEGETLVPHPAADEEPV